MNRATSIKDTMELRYSCRSYEPRPLDASAVTELGDYLRQPKKSPFSSSLRFSLAASVPGDDTSLKGLGTYGVIKNPSAFIIGAMKPSPRNLEDFGYLMEMNILQATRMGLGTCWLGGSYTRSSFAARIGASPDEFVPAVASVGYIAGSKTLIDSTFRYAASSRTRKSWEELFFYGTPSVPLDRHYAGRYALPLEMLRIAPSASNKQPWRMLKDIKGDNYHFYLSRSRAYGFGMRLIGMADLQRVDMGIAMSHFELAARESGLQGSWKTDPAAITIDDMEYVISWIAE